MILVLYCRVKTEAVEIVRIYHSAQNWPARGVTRLLLGKADMRNLPTAGLTCAEEWRLDELVAPDRIT